MRGRHRETASGEVEVSFFGFGWWSADQLARLAWWVSLAALAVGVVQVLNGNLFALASVAIGAGALTFSWTAWALVIPHTRRWRR